MKHTCFVLPTTTKYVSKHKTVSVVLLFDKN